MPLSINFDMHLISCLCYHQIFSQASGIKTKIFCQESPSTLSVDKHRHAHMNCNYLISGHTIFHICIIIKGIQHNLNSTPNHQTENDLEERWQLDSTIHGPVCTSVLLKTSRGNDNNKINNNQSHSQLTPPCLTQFKFMNVTCHYQKYRLPLNLIIPLLLDQTSQISILTIVRLLIIISSRDLDIVTFFLIFLGYAT